MLVTNDIHTAIAIAVNENNFLSRRIWAGISIVGALALLTLSFIMFWSTAWKVVAALEVLALLRLYVVHNNLQQSREMLRQSATEDPTLYRL